MCDGVYIDMINGLPAFVKSDNSNEGFTAGGKTTTDGNVEHLTGPDGREAFDDSNPNSAVYNHYIYLESSRGSGERIFTIGPFDATSGRKRLQFYLNHFGDDRHLKYFAVDLSTDSQNLETIAGSATVIKDNSGGGDQLFDATDPDWQLIEKDLYWDSDMTDFYIVFRVVSEGIFGDWAFDRISVFNNHVCTGLAGYCIGDNAVCSSGSCQCLSDNNSNGVVYVYRTGTSGRSYACDAFECSGVGETCNGPTGNQGGFQTCVSGTCECDETGGDILYYGVRNGNSKLDCQVIQCRVKSHCFDTSDYVFCDLRGTNTDHSDNRCECLADDTNFVYVATSNSGTRNVQCERRMCSVDSDCTENAICNQSFQCVCKPTDNQGTYVTINGNGNTRSTYQCRRVECTGVGETCDGPSGNQGGFQTCENEVCVCQDTSTTLYYGTRASENAKLNCQAIQCRVNSHCTNSGNSGFAVCNTQGTTSELDNRCECQADDSTWLYVEISGSGTKDVSCERRMCSVNNDCTGGNAICDQSSFQCVCKPTDNQGTYVPVNENENRRASYQCRRVECTDDGETCNGPNGNQGGFQTCQNEVCVCQDTSTTLYYGTRENSNAKLNCQAIQCRVNSHCTNFGNSGFVVCNTQGTTSELDNRCECQADDSTWLYVEISNSGTRDVSCERRMCSVNNDCSGGNAICDQSSYQCVCKPTDNQGTYVPINGNGNTRSTYQCRLVECTGDGETCNGPNGQQGAIQTCQNEVCVCVESGNNLYFEERNGNAKLNCRDVQCRVASHCTNYNAQNGYIVCNTANIETNNRCECRADDDNFVYYPTSNNNQKNIVCAAVECRTTSDCIDSGTSNTVCSNNQCVCKGPDSNGYYIQISGTFARRYRCEAVECTADSHCTGPNGNNGANQVCASDNTCECKSNLFIESFTNGKLFCSPIACRVNTDCDFYNGGSGSVVCDTVNFECVCRANTDALVYRYLQGNGQQYQCEARECFSTSDCRGNFVTCSGNQCVCQDKDSAGSYIEVDNSPTNRDLTCKLIECVTHEDCTNTFTQCDFNTNFCVCQNGLYERVTDGNGNPLVPAQCIEIECRVTSDCQGNSNAGNNYVACLDKKCDCRNDFNGIGFLIRDHTTSGRLQECKAVECLEQSHCGEDGADSNVQCNQVDYMCECVPGLFVERRINNQFYGLRECIAVQCLFNKDCQGQYTRCDNQYNCVCQDFTQYNYTQLSPYAECEAYECIDDSYCTGQYATCNNFIKRCHCEPPYFFPDGTTNGRSLRCFRHECLDDSDCPGNRAFCNEELFENRCQCPTNYEPVSGSSGQNLQCQLRNTCVNVQCNANAQCEFGSNGPTCVCDPGWCEDPNSTPGLNVVCKDVNECADPLNCGSTVTCTNTPGSYVCSCSEGFTLYSKKCYRDHFFGPWLNEGVCSTACGTGTQLQLRLCTPAEEGHGTPCPVPFEQRNIPCNIHSCDEGCSRNKLCNKCDSTRAYVTGQEPNMDLSFTGEVFDNRGPLAMSEGESVNSYIDKWALSEVLMKCKAAACDPTKLTDLKNEIEADEIQLNATDADYLAVQYFLRDVVDCNDNIDIEAGLWDIYDYFVDTCICIQNVRRDISSKRMLIMREMERCHGRGWYASMLESIMKSW